MILAKTIYGEARGEYHRVDAGLMGLIAVGNVVMNRVQKGGWFGRTITEVCQKPYQFSCWLRNDPNAAMIAKVTEDDQLYRICLMVSENVMEGLWPDLVKGADHYHAVGIKPAWSVGSQVVARIGNHVFYRLSK